MKLKACNLLGRAKVPVAPEKGGFFRWKNEEAGNFVKSLNYSRACRSACGTGKRWFFCRKFEEAEHEAKSLYLSGRARVPVAPISEVYASAKQNRGQIAGEESPKI